MRFGFLCSFCCEVSFIQPNEFICLSRVSFFAATALSWVLIYAVFVFDLGNILVIWSKPLKILGRLREIFRSRVFGFDDRIQFWFEMGLWILIWHIRFFSSLICSIELSFMCFWVGDDTGDLFQWNPCFFTLCMMYMLRVAMVWSLYALDFSHSLFPLSSRGVESLPHFLFLAPFFHFLSLLLARMVRVFSSSDFRKSTHFLT